MGDLLKSGKLWSVVAGLGCFVAAYFLPQFADELTEAGVGLLVLTGAAKAVAMRKPPQ